MLCVLYRTENVQPRSSKVRVKFFSLNFKRNQSMFQKIVKNSDFVSHYNARNGNWLWIWICSMSPTIFHRECMLESKRLSKWPPKFGSHSLQKVQSQNRMWRDMILVTLLVNISKKKCCTEIHWFVNVKLILNSGNIICAKYFTAEKRDYTVLWFLTVRILCFYSFYISTTEIFKITFNLKSAFNVGWDVC